MEPNAYTPKAISMIASATAAAVPGVAALGATLSEAAAKKIGHASPTQGVEAIVVEDTVELTIRLVVQYGYRIPDVALHVQKSVKDTVEEKMGCDVTAVHILIQGVTYDTSS